MVPFNVWRLQVATTTKKIMTFEPSRCKLKADVKSAINMFGTLQYDSRTKDALFVARTDTSQYTQPGGFVAPHSACNKCRARKVRPKLLLGLPR